jgi:hypothetical protein
MIEQTSPVGGLNYLDSLELMKPEDARVLDNWIPDMGLCVIRESGLEVADLTEDLE